MSEYECIHARYGLGDVLREMGFSGTPDESLSLIARAKEGVPIGGYPLADRARVIAKYVEDEIARASK